MESVAVELGIGDTPSGGVPLGIPPEPTGGAPPGGVPPLGGAPLNPSGGVPPGPPCGPAWDGCSVAFDCSVLLFTFISSRLLFLPMAVTGGVRFSDNPVAFLIIVWLAVGDTYESVAEVRS